MSAVQAPLFTVPPERRTNQVLASQGESSGGDGSLLEDNRELEAAGKCHLSELCGGREFLKKDYRGSGDVTVPIHRLILLPTVAPSFASTSCACTS
jgi:hypothetical protein